jgi:phosphoglycolate phosphatase-like HAD superfamily hydrolase
MSGGLFIIAAAREIEREIGVKEEQEIQSRHGELFREFLPERRPLPGAIKLLEFLRSNNIVHGITISGRRQESICKVKNYRPFIPARF